MTLPKITGIRQLLLKLSRGLVCILYIATQCNSNLLQTTTTTTVLWPLYKPTCVSRHLQLRTGGFCLCSFAARMPMLTANSTFRLGRRRWSSPQQCHLQSTFIYFNERLNYLQLHLKQVASYRWHCNRNDKKMNL